MAFKDLFKTKAERRAYAIGRKHQASYKGGKRNIKSTKITKSKNKLFDFLAFNQNGDVFNVHSEGSSRSNALKNAKRHLKRDPEVPSWGVSITNDKANDDFYRHIIVKSSGNVHDNWKIHYRDSDDDIRRKYRDLSSPVKGYKY